MPLTFGTAGLRFVLTIFLRICSLQRVFLSTVYMHSTLSQIEDYDETTTTLTHNIETTEINMLQYLDQNISMHGHSSDFTSLLEYKVYMFFVKYFLYITSILGLITNPLSVFIAAKITPKGTSELHMIVLGVTDFIVVSLRIALYSMNIVKFLWTDAACKAMLYTLNVSYVYSNLVVVS